MRKVEEKGNIERREGKGETSPWKIGRNCCFLVSSSGKMEENLTSIYGGN